MPFFLLVICRTPPGVRELKLDVIAEEADTDRRTPPGVRELKLHIPQEATWARVSHPSRGA